MNYKVLAILAIVACIISCREIEVEFGSPNDYYIENVSSEELYYYTFEDSTEVVIPVDETVVIEETNPTGNQSFLANEYFTSIADISGGDIYLFRDENGEKTLALKLNANDELSWISVIYDERENSLNADHTLTVTDEMLE